MQHYKKEKITLAYSVYVKIDQDNYIVAVNSSIFLSDTAGWAKIDEGYGDRYYHAQGNYFSKSLRTDKGAYRYKLVNGSSQECSNEEILEQENKNEASKPSNANKQKVKSQMQRAVQLFAMTLPEKTALEIPYVYDSWKKGRAYVIDEYLTYGTNTVGDPQLYKVVQAHTSQEDWTPDITPALYTPIGLDNSGYPIWAQPTGAHDAYNIGDIVNYNGALYKSLIDGNVYSPEAYPDGWELYTE